MVVVSRRSCELSQNDVSHIPTKNKRIPLCVLERSERLPVIALPGSTGQLGARVARRLASADVSQRLIVRDAARAPQLAGAETAVAAGYRDVAGMTAALHGIATVFFVSATESAERLDDHRSFVAAAIAADAKRIVYTSFIDASPRSTFTLARDHAATEECIRDSGLAFTFLRDSFYADFMPKLASSDGVIAGPGGTGRVACVARDDVADVAAVVVADDAHSGSTYNLTGPEALTFAEIAATIAVACGRPVTYRAETLEEAYASRAKYNAPAFEVDGWVSTYTAIAKNECAAISPDVATLLGRRPQSLAEVLKAYPDSYSHITD
jgi:NAD(P)H dehydrogenase (quinone)